MYDVVCNYDSNKLAKIVSSLGKHRFPTSNHIHLILSSTKLSLLNMNHFKISAESRFQLDYNFNIRDDMFLEVKKNKVEEIKERDRYLIRDRILDERKYRNKGSENQ